MKFVALVALMTLAASASAQTAKKTVTPATWQTVWFQYNPSSTKSDYDYYNNLYFLSSITDDSTRKIRIDYSAGGLKRVTSITEFGLEITGHKYD